MYRKSIALSLVSVLVAWTNCLSFTLKFYVMAKALSGKLSCSQKGLVIQNDICCIHLPCVDVTVGYKLKFGEEVMPKFMPGSLF